MRSLPHSPPVQSLAVVTLAVVTLAGGLLVSGCQTPLYQHPSTGPGVDAVFQAAKRVIEDRFPMSTAIVHSSAVIASTPVELEGASKSRMTISVYVRRNYTGAWEPIVRVAKYLEVGEPPLGADPAAEIPAYAGLHSPQRWTPLQNMVVIEQALRDEILRAI